MTTHHHSPSFTSHPPNVSFTTPQVACHSPSQHDDLSALRKPHTPVSCPRCDSLETKFCYFNNYNVKQPRHFCRSCQRYWTAGGALRNLPIGAGRRKIKNCVISGNPRSEAVIQRSDHLEAAQRLQFSNHSGDDVDPGLEIPVTDIIDSRSVSSGLQSFPQQQHCNSSLVFPSGPPVLSAMERSEQESAFGLKDRENGIRGLKVPESDTLFAPGSPIDAVQNDDSILCSSVTASSSSLLSEGDSILLSEGGTSTSSNMELTEGFSAPTGWDGAALPLVLPFPYVLNNVAAYPGAADGLFPLPSVFTPLWTPFGWGVPLNFAWNANAAAAAAATLGKRQRPPVEKQGSLCVPKTLRVNHPEEAAQSSILTSLGFGGVPALSPTSNCFHNAFQREAAVLRPKTEVGNSNLHIETQHLHTNPAAQARSIAFQEGN